jgi:hypothetical protein
MRDLAARVYAACATHGLIHAAVVTPAGGGQAYTLAVGYTSPSELQLNGETISEAATFKVAASHAPALARGDQVALAGILYRVVRIEPIGDRQELRAVLSAIILTQQLPDTPTISAPAAVALLAGQPVYITADGQIGLAAADGLPQAQVSGIMLSPAGAGAEAVYASDGSVVRADWRPITGTLGLTQGARYYLGPDPGTITTSIPTGATSAFALPVGYAVSETRLDIEIGQIIQLLED